MVTRTVGGERIDTHGRKAEDVDISVLTADGSNSVSLFIQGEKTTRQ